MLNADTIIAEARQKTGLHDFGTPEAEANMRRLVDAINAEARLSANGERRFHVAGVYLACNQLLLGELLKTTPDLRDRDIGEAIKIVGMPRTGSTKLQRLIAQDSRLMHMTLRDVALPLAFPGERVTEVRDALISAMEAELGQPELQAGHLTAIAEPEEEVELQKNHFTPRLMNDHVSIPGWQEWVKALDPRPKQIVVRQMIAANAMQLGKSGIAWIFKNAYAGEDLDAIAEVFPHTKFVMTHRNPQQHFTSLLALGHHWRVFHSDDVTKEQSGRDYLKFWSDFVERMMVALEKVPTERILHVRYKDVLADPMDVIGRIYDFCGYPLTDEAVAAMGAYDTRNVQHAHGEHRYSLEEFGLTPQQVEAAYAPYLERYGDMI